MRSSGVYGWGRESVSIRSRCADSRLEEFPGGRSYERLRARRVQIRMFSFNISCFHLEALIRPAAGRARHIETIAELEALREEKLRGGG
jgi:hypothetical protein